MKIKTTWVLLSLGVLMTVVSAAISTYLIDGNRKQIDKVEKKSLTIVSQIDSLWYNAQLLEQKKDTAILLLSNSSDLGTLFKGFIHDTIKSTGLKVDEKLPDSNKDLYNLFLNKASLHKAVIINQINDLYLKKLEFDDEAIALNQENSTLVSIALFFQVMGLILVLSKHF